MCFLTVAARRCYPEAASARMYFLSIIVTIRCFLSIMAVPGKSIASANLLYKVTSGNSCSNKVLPDKSISNKL